jgi:oligopeptide/dipeptide ABC transporter ATP-binding protein
MLDAQSALLDVQDLEVRFITEEGTVKAVNGANLCVRPGGSIGIVGESGSGKTVTAHAIMRILPNSARIPNGKILYQLSGGQTLDLAKMDPESDEMRKIRGGEIAMIFQEPMSSLSPVHTVYNQISEAIFLHQEANPEQARDRVRELLTLVGIPNPEQRMDEYPFQLSGGMRQRVMIAMALSCNPRILIADEPTTALDVTIQAQVLRLIKQMQERFNLSLILITHDLGVVAHMVEHVYVMYLGRIVEDGPVKQIFKHPAHPYTQGLLGSIPRLIGARGRLQSIRGVVPSATNIPRGCPFHPRCNRVVGAMCLQSIPPRIEIDKEHHVSCFLYGEEVQHEQTTG